MTVFITRCWKKWLERTLVLFAGLLALGIAQAGSIEPISANLVPDEQGYAITASFAIKLTPRLEEAIERGVSLHFRFEFILTRKRWQVYDEHIAGRVLSYKLSYHALTRQYRLTQGSQSQNFDSLDDALKTLGRPPRLHAVERSALVPGEPYRAAVRLSLDHEQLSKPLQIDALGDRGWRIETKPQRWDFVPAADK